MTLKKYLFFLLLVTPGFESLASWKLVPNTPTIVMSPELVAQRSGNSYIFAMTSSVNNNLNFLEVPVKSLTSGSLVGTLRNWGGKHVTGPSCDQRTFVYNNGVLCAGLGTNGTMQASLIYDEKKPNLKPKWTTYNNGANSSPAVYFDMWGSLGSATLLVRGPKNNLYAARVHYKDGLFPETSSWQNLGGVIHSAPKCLSWNSNWGVFGLFCVAIGTDGRLWGIDFFKDSGPDGKWSSWYLLSDSQELDPTARVSIVGSRSIQYVGQFFLRFYARSKSGKLISNYIYLTKGETTIPAPVTSLAGKKLQRKNWFVHEAPELITPGTGPACQNSGTILQDICLINGPGSKLYFGHFPAWPD